MRRYLGISLLLGLLIATGGMQLSTRSVSAQAATTATVSCNSATCTVVLNGYVAPGGSFSVSLPSGQPATISCPSGCSAGSQYTVNLNGTATQTAYVSTAPQTAVYTSTTVATAPPGGLCVNGSVPTYLGCTSTSLPYYPAYYQQSYYPSYYSSYNPWWGSHWNNNWWNNNWWNNNNGCNNTPGCNPCTWTPVTWRHC